MRDNQKTRKDYMKWLLLGVILVFILSMVPLFYISIYSHPLFDDYSYSLCIRKLIDGGDYSVTDMLRTSIDETCRTWKVWQGCYSATFFATLQPGVFSSNTYWITTLVLLGGLMISQVLLWKAIAHNLLGCDIKCALIISLLLAEFQIQFVPFIQEAFYWYNGGMAYTFFYSLMCILISVEVRMFVNDKGNIFRFVIGILLSFIISGGNFSTALVSLMILVTFSIYSFIFCRKKSGLFIAISITAIIGLMINILAPGNSVRAANNVSLPAFAAIVESIKYTINCIFRWTGLAQIGLVILLVILFYPAVKESECKFRFPLLFLVLAFGFFAALSTPPFYAMSNQGGLRQINMYYYAYYLWLAVSVLYLEGWIVSKIKEGKIFTKIAKFRYVCIFTALVLIVSGTFMYGLKSTAFFTTFLDLKSGRAQRYDAEYKRIVTLIEQSGPEDVVYTSDINEWPNSFYRLGLGNRGDVGYWVNSDMAKWFGVGAIELEE